MSENFYRETWAEIDLDAVEHNVRRMKQHLPEGTQLMAVVKADGYGHGAEPVARTALEAGATWLGVALLDEAIALRKAGVHAPILVLGWTRPQDVDLAARHHISLTVFQKEWLEEASRCYKDASPVFFHIKCDTGMGRIGVRTPEELSEVVRALQADSRFVAEGFFTHFATADEADEAYFRRQYQRFVDMTEQLKSLGINPNLIHCANSAAALKYPEKMFNMVRYGIAMYGLSPSPEMKDRLPFELKEAFTLKSRLVHVKLIEPGEGVSYGVAFRAAEPTWVGTVPIGYADGWQRALSGKASVLVAGKRCPIIGRICMDQLMIALDGPVPVGELVTLIGEDGAERIGIDDIAVMLGTINYEIPCMISKRVPRIYFKNGKIVRTANLIL